MTRGTWTVLIASAAALCAASSAEDAERRTLEERVAELERTVARLEQKVPAAALPNAVTPLEAQRFGLAPPKFMPRGAVAPTPDGRGYFFPADSLGTAARTAD